MNQQFPSRGATEWTMSESEFEEVRRVIYDYSGIVIGPEKRSMIRARLQKRLGTIGEVSLSEYLKTLSTDVSGKERQKFVSLLTTNVTSFFRESHHFDLLAETILPQLSGRQTKPIRLWSAGCSSGQEPYSIAMTVLDRCPTLADQVMIDASDIDCSILDRAKEGRYRLSDVKALPSKTAQRYFDTPPEYKDEAVIRLAVRKLVKFKQVNLNDNWRSATRYNAIFCRNVAIYFNQQTQEKLWRKFHDSLQPGGWLLIGHSERVPSSLHGILKPAGITAYQRPE